MVSLISMFLNYLNNNDLFFKNNCHLLADKTCHLSIRGNILKDLMKKDYHGNSFSIFDLNKN